jgi:MFS family permease
MARSLAPLRHRGFRLLVSGQLASNVGDAFYAVALPWYVLAEHGGALLLGTVLAAYGIPRTVLLAVGGHASDRWRPWTVMMTSDVLRAFAAAALAVAAATGPARAVVLVPIAAVLGAGEGLFLPGSFAIVPALLPDEELQAGNALASSGTQLATLAGPAVGGALVALLGPAPAFAVDAVSFVVSAATLFGVRSAMRPATAAARPAAATSTGTGKSEGTLRPAPEPARYGGARDGITRDDNAGDRGAPDGAVRDGAVRDGAVRDGAVRHGRIPGGDVHDDAVRDVGGGARTLWQVLRSERVLQIMLLVTIAGNLGMGGADEVALPSLVRGPLHGGAGGYGALIAAFGAGALAGTLAAGQVRQAGRPAIVAFIAFLIEALFMAVVPYAGGLIPVGAVMAAIGIGNGFGNVVMITVFQRWTPPGLLGRLTGLLMLCSVGVFPVSVALAAVVVHNFGPAPFFPLGAAVLAAAILVALSQRDCRNLGATGPSSSAARPRRLLRSPSSAPASTDTMECA